MKTKLLIPHLSANTNPSLYNLSQLLPDDFRTITKFPPMLGSQQLMFIGHANLRKMERVLINARCILKEESKLIQKEIDDLDDLAPSCIQTMAQNSGCTYSVTTVQSPSPSPTKSIIYTCEFGQHVAACCKMQSKIRIGSATPTKCFFAEDTENRVDNCIGELIGLINRYDDFVDKLDKYILRVQHAAADIAFSRPLFLRWRHKEYPRPGDRVINFKIKKVDGKIQARRHEAICLRLDRNPNRRFPTIVCSDPANGKEFSVEHSNRLITAHDYKLMRGDPYAQIWLENYTWPTSNAEEAEILTALKAAFTKLLLT